jgi:EAL domain-containing protein (putative c-di-GMP-specific phosphodiesterase class I)
MSPIAPPERGQTAPLPELALMFDRVGEALAERSRLGILSISLLQRRPSNAPEEWPSYDGAVEEITRFLVEYRNSRMRADDRLFGPSTSGNTFVLVLSPPRLARPLEMDDLRKVGGRLLRRLRVHLARQLSAESAARFGCYVGIALMRHDPSVRVDRVMYRALEQAFAGALRERELENRRHAIDLEEVLDRRLVHTVYQPVVHVPSRSVLGYEALTRVARHRFANTEILFKSAYEIDTLFTLERLCRRKALEGGILPGARQLLFLNIEPDSLNDPDFVNGDFSKRLAEAGLEPRRIVIEMTERSDVDDYARFRDSLEALRCQGYRLAMDDFGSGHGGLNSIAELSPDYLKMDMALVRDIHRSPIKREIVSTITRFAESTGITVIAEGVEQPEEMHSLLDAGVRCAQGYLFARPEASASDPDWSVLPSAEPAPPLRTRGLPRSVTYALCYDQEGGVRVEPSNEGTSLRPTLRATLAGDGRAGPIEERLGRRLIRLVDPDSEEGRGLLESGSVSLIGPEGEKLGAMRLEEAYRLLRERLEKRLLDPAADAERGAVNEGLSRLIGRAERLGRS